MESVKIGPTVGAGEFVAGFIAISVVALVCCDADELSYFTSKMLSAV